MVLPGDEGRSVGERWSPHGKEVMAGETVETTSGGLNDSAERNMYIWKEQRY